MSASDIKVEENQVKLKSHQTPEKIASIAAQRRMFELLAIAGVGHTFFTACLHLVGASNSELSCYDNNGLVQAGGTAAKQLSIFNSVVSNHMILVVYGYVCASCLMITGCIGMTTETLVFSKLQKTRLFVVILSLLMLVPMYLMSCNFALCFAQYASDAQCPVPVIMFVIVLVFSFMFLSGIPIVLLIHDLNANRHVNITVQPLYCERTRSMSQECGVEENVHLTPDTTNSKVIPTPDPTSFEKMTPESSNLETTT